MRKTLSILAISLFALTLTGCPGTTWEKATYSTLATSSKVIKAARADYRAGTIAHTQVAYDVLEKAKVAHNAATHAFAGYLEAKVALEIVKDDHDSEATLAQQRYNIALAKVTDALAELGAAVIEVRKLTK